MEDNFAEARFEGIRKNRYLLKHLKNKTARIFISTYNDSKKEKTNDLKKLACIYNRLDRGSLSIHIFDTDIEMISENDVEEVYVKIKQNADKNFKCFYESYLRKIEMGYEEEYIQTALEDLKNAYYTYRKASNPSWDLEDYQITENEMKNLYDILIPNSEEKISDKKELEEKQ